MSEYPDHYPIQRMSVVVVGIILLVGIVAMLANYRPSESTQPIVIPGVNGTSTPLPKISIEPPKPNVTKVFAQYNFTEGLESVNALDIYTFNSSKLFRFEYAYNPLAVAIVQLLGLPANEITPWTYGELYNVLDANYTEWTRNETVSLYYYPMNMSQNAIYVNFTYQTRPQFVDAYPELEKYYPFPPSDKVVVGGPMYKIIKEYTVHTYVESQPFSFPYLQYQYSYSYPLGNLTIVCVFDYWGLWVFGIADLYANGQPIALQWYSYAFPWYGGYYGPNYIYGQVTVPPGVQKTVYAGYAISTSWGFSVYGYSSGNTIYIVYNFYATNPTFISYDYYFNWYEYNVSVPIEIYVYNGSNPVTWVGDKAFTTREISTAFWYTTWSSEPQQNWTTIVTKDHIMFLSYNVTRTWTAGTISVLPVPYQQSWGNTINYYLTFQVSSDIKEPPSYVFRQIPQLNETAVLEWSYFFNNFSVAEGLWDLAHHNVDIFDFVLPQLVVGVLDNGTVIRDELANVNATVTLASFVVPWNVSNVTLNVSDVLYPSHAVFLPVDIVPNTTYSILYYALGSPTEEPNVTVLDYMWYNATTWYNKTTNTLVTVGYFPPIPLNPLTNTSVEPTTYSPFSSTIGLDYGYYWPYGLPYAEFSIYQLDRQYSYWYSPAWLEWFPIT